MFSTTKEQFEIFFSNPIFLASISSWFSAQFIKTVLSLLRGNVADVKELIALLLWRTGGMPSSHSALVFAMTTSIGFSAGVDSNVFVLSSCFTLVVIRDALGVRRASGIQARKINELGRSLQKKGILEFTPIKEVHGHKPLEVIIGCFLGLFMAIAFSVL